MFDLKNLYSFRFLFFTGLYIKRPSIYQTWSCQILKDSIWVDISIFGPSVISISLN